MKKRTKLIALLLVLAMIAGIALAIPGGAASISQNQNQYNRLESELKSIKESQAAIQKNLADARAQAQSQQKIVNLIYDEIESFQKELDTTSALIEEYTALVQVKEQQIAELNARLSENFSLFKERLVFAQESGNMSYIDFILGSSDLSDILSRSEVINDMLEYDRSIITGLSNDKAQIEATKIEVENALKLCEEKKAEYEATLAALNEKVAEANTYLAQLQSDLEAQQAAANRVNQSKKNLENEMDKLAEEIERQRQEQLAAQNKPGGGSSTFTGTFIWPLPANANCSISQGFHSGHSGMDIQTYRNPNVPALSVAAGTVIRCGSYWDWGNLVVVDHGGGYITYYAHLNSISVSVGQKVTQGQQVGIIGTTGQSTGIHLHIVFYENGKRVDPARFIQKP